MSIVLSHKRKHGISIHCNYDKKVNHILSGRLLSQGVVFHIYMMKSAESMLDLHHNWIKTKIAKNECKFLFHRYVSVSQYPVIDFT